MADNVVHLKKGDDIAIVDEGSVAHKGYASQGYEPYDPATTAAAPATETKDGGKPAETKAEAKPAETAKAPETKTAETKAADTKTAETKAADTKTAEK